MSAGEGESSGVAVGEGSVPGVTAGVASAMGEGVGEGEAKGAGVVAEGAPWQPVKRKKNAANNRVSILLRVSLINAAASPSFISLIS